MTHCRFKAESEKWEAIVRQNTGHSSRPVMNTVHCAVCDVTEGAWVCVLLEWTILFYGGWFTL